MKLLLLYATLLGLIILTGCAGPKGDTGAPGLIGAPGAPGQDATPVTAIQFCPSQGHTTHSHFPEYGICINEKLYGVYWDSHNAFLAEIVPGPYVSTSTGLQCSFAVLSACNVSEL